MARAMTPGEKLFCWLLDRYKQQSNTSSSWINAIGADFNIPDLEDVLIKSTILMLLRRLLWAANWFENTYPSSDLSILNDIFEREYLLGVLGLEKDERTRVSGLVFDSLAASRKEISPGVMKTMKERARRISQRCTFCGCMIDYNSDTLSSFSLDHIWPKSLGGTSEEWNLRVVCRDCNSIRQNYVDVSDTHYEHFHVKEKWSSDPRSSFWIELNKDFRIAALMQANFQCQICGDHVPIDKMDGGLDFLPINRHEYYHIFNIQVACGKHRV